MKPDPTLIESMCLRYRHDFGFLDEPTKRAIRTTMTQIWEEVVGLGFYKGEMLYTEEQAKQIWKAGQEYWKTSGASITFEELTQKLKNK